MEQKPKKFARKCDCCGKGMNKGYLVNGDYYCSDKCLGEHYSIQEQSDLDIGGDDSDNYWTEWTNKEDYEFELINGVLTEIEPK